MARIWYWFKKTYYIEDTTSSQSTNVVKQEIYEVEFNEEVLIITSTFILH